MNNSADENYFSEEGIEKSTESLMRKLEHAKDPKSYRDQFHRHGASSKKAAKQKHNARGEGRHLHPLLITAIAIFVGVLTGIFLIMYVF